MHHHTMGHQILLALRDELASLNTVLDLACSAGGGGGGGGGDGGGGNQGPQGNHPEITTRDLPVSPSPCFALRACCVALRPLKLAEDAGPLLTGLSHSQPDAPAPEEAYIF